MASQTLGVKCSPAVFWVRRRVHLSPLHPSLAFSSTILAISHSAETILDSMPLPLGMCPLHSHTTTSHIFKSFFLKWHSVIFSLNFEIKSPVSPLSLTVLISLSSIISLHSTYQLQISLFNLFSMLSLIGLVPQKDRIFINLCMTVSLLPRIVPDP